MTIYISFAGHDPYHQTKKEFAQLIIKRGIKSFKEIQVPPYGNGQFTWFINPLNGCKFTVIISKDGTAIQNLFERDAVLEIMREQKRFHLRQIAPHLVK